MHILVSDNLHEAGIAVLDEAADITYYANGKMERGDVIAALENATGLIVRSGTTADAELLAHAPNLKAIVRAGVGVDNIDLSTATEQGIVVMNTPQANTIATAEHTIALMLALARHIPQAQQSLLNGQWERKAFTGTELKRKILGLIGLGRVGRAVAKRAQAFGMTIIASDPFIPADVAADLGVELLPQSEVFTQADYLSLHAVVTPKTRHMINAESIATMKKGVRIINVARGALVNADDLAQAIENGHVAGAAVDVYETEPPSANHPLIGLPQVIVTPHLGASTNEAQIAVGIEAAEKMINALRSQNYEDVVNRQVFE